MPESSILLITTDYYPQGIIIAALASWKGALRTFLRLAIILGLGVWSVMIFWLFVWVWGAVSDVANAALHGVRHERGRGHHAPLEIFCPSAFCH